jgi:isopentenyl phosphate kinase
MVCKYLQNEGLPTIPLQPSSFILTRNKRIKLADINLITKYLEMNFIPVLYGDVVLDTGPSKMAVLSGDQIITYLAGKLQAEKVILATDVDGIYDKNPKKYPQARLLEKVTSKEDIKTGEETNIDVTGGMGGKVTELLDLLKLGIESQIINANREGNIKKILSGEKVNGTTIKNG